MLHLYLVKERSQSRPTYCLMWLQIVLYAWVRPGECRDRLFKKSWPSPARFLPVYSWLPPHKNRCPTAFAAELDNGRISRVLTCERQHRHFIRSIFQHWSFPAFWYCCSVWVPIHLSVFHCRCVCHREVPPHTTAFEGGEGNLKIRRYTES
jgi:hypothetical protein